MGNPYGVENSTGAPALGGAYLMNLLCDRQTLVEAVANVSRAVSTKSTLAALEGVLMKALRANLRELRHRLLKEMEDFIQQYDVTHPSC